MSNIIPKRPADSLFTDAQWRAIHEGGRDVLVSAAAGSGKTKVLITRLVEKVIRHGIHVDELLVVTFTNAAAAEMRQRLGSELEEKIEEMERDDQKEHLRRQVVLLNKAHISTLHSFCSAVVRQYAYLLDIDPGFRLASEQEVALLQEEALAEVLETAYASEQKEAIYELADRFAKGRDDVGLETLIYSMYDYARVEPNPLEWLRRIPAQYNFAAYDTFEQHPLYDIYVQYIQQEATEIFEAYETLVHYLEEEKEKGSAIPSKMYALLIGEDADKIMRLQQALQAPSWDDMATYLPGTEQSRKWGSPRIQKGEDKEINERAKKLRNQLKKMYDAFIQRLERSTERLVEDMQTMYPSIRTLIGLVEQFHQTYEQMKREEAILDFGDLEHYALQILSEDGYGKEPSPIAKLYQQQFEEVLVDEYQDTNVLQERIIQLVKRGTEGDGNLFMVGDVKQSIYRFRLAEPNLFLNKMARFTADGSDPNTGIIIHLNRNFRSRFSILESTNDIFRQVMDEEVGEIEYDEEAALVYGATYYERADEEEKVAPLQRPTTIVYITEDETDEKVSKEVYEARYMAKQIKKWIHEGKLVRDEQTGNLRRIEYRDIAILKRSMSEAAHMAEVFRTEGIPIYVSLSSGFFEAVEVQLMLSVLQTIDNPYQDIPLVATLRAPFYRFTENELARIRLAARHVPYYDALRTFGETDTTPLGERVRTFLNQLTLWRNLARQTSLADLIWDIYLQTKYYEMLGAMPNSKQRQANLRALHDQAIAYEKTAFRGLFSFLRFIERMRKQQDDIGEAHYVTSEENVVRMMTIHSSKGLEFPIVFVSSLHKQFNLKDVQGAYMFDQQYGLAVKAIYPEKNIERMTLLGELTKAKKEREMKAEEMRILYVAMTRAKEQLYLIGFTTETNEEKWKHISESALQEMDGKLPRTSRASAMSYFDWIVPAVYNLRGLASIEEKKVAQSSLQEEEKEDVVLDLNPVEMEEWEELVKHRFHQQYAYEKETKRSSKESVSAVNRALQEDQYEGTPIASFVPQDSSSFTVRPQFVQAQQLTAAERGTAVHAVMEHLPWDIQADEVVVTEWLETLVKDELLTEEEAAVIEPAEIVQFLQSPLAAQLRRASRIERELPFTYAYRKEPSAEPQLMQGIIDSLFIEEDRLYILDFKTDRIAHLSDRSATLHERYAVQLNLYRQAVERAIEKPVEALLIYSFDTHETYTIEKRPIE